MSTEALVLAVVSIIRPTTAAAVWAMLMGTRPRRLLACYLLAGLAVSLTTGTALVLFVGGVLSPRTVSEHRATLLVVLGAAAVLFAVAVRLGWAGRPRPGRPPVAHRVHGLTPAGAAMTGVVTHLPGVVYLAALSAIVGTGANAVGGVLQVVVYNAIWFSPAIAAFAACLTGTVPPADRLDAPLAWARANRADLLAASSGVLGVWLIAKGVLDMG